MKKKIFVQSLFMCIIIIFLLAGYTFAEILQNDFVIITYHEQDHRIAEEILNKFSGIVTQTNREVGFYDIPVIQLVLTHSKKEFDEYITRGKLPESSIAMAIPALSKIIIRNP
ncbi:MAG: hypothetical protein P9M09_00695, partial [Candidatus Celaenobacter antarcticus]|nr:hypothetical protein [Candidatus Celaenobacter antarcticus]